MGLDFYPKFKSCPRCRIKAYETFKNHDCCYECSYSTVLDYKKNYERVPKWAIDAVNKLEEKINIGSNPKTESLSDDAGIYTIYKNSEGPQ